MLYQRAVAAAERKSTPDLCERPKVQIGDVRRSYTMQPLDAKGALINGGNHYANASTIEDARDYAARVLTGGLMGMTVYSVSIEGAMYEFTGEFWRVRRTDPQWTNETIHRETPAPLTSADEAMACYDTTVMDYFETVHPRRSDGSCKCGHYSRYELNGAVR